MLGIVTQSLAKYGTIFIFVSEIFLLSKYFLEKQLWVVVVSDNFTCEISVLKLPEDAWPQGARGSVIILYYNSTKKLPGHCHYQATTSVPTSHRRPRCLLSVFSVSDQTITEITAVGKNSNYGQNYDRTF